MHRLRHRIGARLENRCDGRCRGDQPDLVDEHRPRQVGGETHQFDGPVEFAELLQRDLDRLPFLARQVETVVTLCVVQQRHGTRRPAADVDIEAIPLLRFDITGMKGEPQRPVPEGANRRRGLELQEPHAAASQRRRGDCGRRVACEHRATAVDYERLGAAARTALPATPQLVSEQDQVLGRQHDEAP